MHVPSTSHRLQRHRLASKPRELGQLGVLGPQRKHTNMLSLQLNKLDTLLCNGTKCSSSQGHATYHHVPNTTNGTASPDCLQNGQKWCQRGLSGGSPDWQSHGPCLGVTLECITYPPNTPAAAGTTCTPTAWAPNGRPTSDDRGGEAQTHQVGPFGIHILSEVR